MSSSVHIDNKRKDTLIPVIGPTKELDDITLTPEAQHSINFSRSLHYNGSNSFLFVNDTKIYQYISSKQKILK